MTKSANNEAKKKKKKKGIQHPSFHASWLKLTSVGTDELQLVQ